jgi:hypothetical protein
MSGNRLRELWSPAEPAGLVPELPSAFVLCPMPVLQFMAPWQYAQAMSLYQLAYQQAQAQAQAHRPQLLRIPAFSAN